MSATVTRTLTQRGYLVFWKFRQFTTDRTELEKRLASLGDLRHQPRKKYKGKSSTAKRTYADLLQRNDYKSSLLRASRAVVKTVRQNVAEGDIDRFYRRHDDTEGTVKVSFLNQSSDAAGKVVYLTEVTVRLDKKSGALTEEYVGKSQLAQSIAAELPGAYQKAQKTLDTDQLSSLLRRIAHEDCLAVNWKGGCYYIREDQAEGIAALEKVAAAFDTQDIALYKASLYDDDATKKAIQVAVEDDMLDKMETLKNEFYATTKAGKMTKNVRDNRRAEIHTLMDRVRVYQDDLSSKALVLQTRLKEFEQAFGKMEKFAEDAVGDEHFLLKLLQL
jgi:hypothetical protein